MKKVVLLIVGIISLIVGALLVRDSKWYFEKYVKISPRISSVLISEFVSFQSVEEVTNRLRREEKEWSVKLDTKFPGDEFRPEFSEYSNRNPGSCNIKFIASEDQEAAAKAAG